MVSSPMCSNAGGGYDEAELEMQFLYIVGEFSDIVYVYIF